jgi:glycosyltransferase involved in cell wall biosynthesis
MADVVIVIPAFQPDPSLQDLVGALLDGLLNAGCQAIVVVNDGSGPEFAARFQALTASPRVHVVHHAINLGKGAALKTGMNYALVRFPACGIVTADADGQHHPQDILQVVARLRENPDALIMGARTFQSGVPWRSRLGNTVTRVLMNLLVGQNLSDTQTGLRGVPNALIPHLLRIPASGYDFELDMLVACKHQSCRVLEEPIRTIYLRRNASSHFDPILDSMRIYLVLFRFSLLALLTAALDNSVFILAFSKTGSIAKSQIAARFVAMIFNYFGAHRAVFHSRQRHAAVLPKYVTLVVFNGLLSYAAIQFLHHRLTSSAITAKLIAEGLLFLANFAIQRDFVFTQRRPSSAVTDWDQYYRKIPATARITRKYTARVLVDMIRRYGTPSESSGLSIVEIGGANSCFVEAIMAKIRTRFYDVIDTNEFGLSLLARRAAASPPVRLYRQSVLDLSYDEKSDLVFSVGLVEHFTPADTRSAILAHFDALRPGGILVIAFPTPTFLYRAAKTLIEICGMWKFPDERPLKPAEVLASIGERGDVLCRKTLWPLILTQHLVVARKFADGAAAVE